MKTPYVKLLIGFLLKFWMLFCIAAVVACLIGGFCYHRFHCLFMAPFFWWLAKVFAASAKENKED